MLRFVLKKEFSFILVLLVLIPKSYSSTLKKITVGILDIKTGMEIPEDVKSVFIEKLERGLSLNYKVVPYKKIKDKLQKMGLLPSFCVSKECREVILETFSLDCIIEGNIERIGKVYKIKFEFLGSDKFRYLTVEDSCEICGIEEVKNKLYLLGKKLKLEIPKRVPSSTLLVKGVKRDEGVVIDGVKVGEGELSFRIFSGKHKLYLEKKGNNGDVIFRTKPIDIEVKKGELYKVDLSGLSFTLYKSPLYSKEKEKRKIIKQWVTWSIIGIGFSLAIAGGILYWIDGKCAEEKKGAEEICESYYNTGELGIGLLSSGAVSVLLPSIFLWIF